MASDQLDTTNKDENVQLPVEIDDWNGLIRHVNYFIGLISILICTFFVQTQDLCQGSDKKVKICMIDEDKDEIRIQTKEEFDLNVKVNKHFIFFLLNDSY